MTSSILHISYRSGNHKTGSMTVTTTSGDSCPASCPLNGNGCYAINGHLGMHWKKVSSGERGLPYREAAAAILTDRRKVTPIVRLNQAGDLPVNDRGDIDIDAVSDLVSALTKKGGERIYTYTHRLRPRDIAAIRTLHDMHPNLTVNLSANNVKHADILRQAYPDMPIACLHPFDTDRPKNLAKCPAQLSDSISCFSCGNGSPLCSRRDRTQYIGFDPHGTKAEDARKVTTR